MNYSFINTNFTAGEISPRLLGRTDVARYNNGAKVLENVIPLIHGGVIRRPGLRYVATSKDSTKACRLLKFTYNTDQSYIIELGDLYARFYNDAGAQIESSPGVPYEVVTPYTEAQIWQVDYCQGADTMFLFHPDHAPSRLQRFADDNWRVMLAPIDPEPFDELGILASMACTLSSAAIGSRTFTAASAVFLASDVGRRITSAAGIGTITGYTSTTVVTVNVTQAFPSTTLAASAWTIEGSPQTSCTPSAKDPVGATITLTLAAAGWRSDDVGRFVNINGGLCKITAYTSSTVVSAQLRTELAAVVAAEANAWFLARSMWGGANGYPRTGSLYQQRLFVGGSYGFPQSVWFSELGNPYSFEIGAEADSAYEMRLVSDQANPVLNLASSRAVLALTSGTEFSLGGDGGVSPATITAINQSSFGSSDVTPCRLGNELLFVNRSGLKIRAMAADRFDSNQYAAPDITALSEHITESGIVEIDAQTDPENILWCVRNDGQMATCTLDRDNEVVAWARQITQGLFESVCVVPFGDSYSVWVVVQRVINGVNVRYIERFDWNVSLDSALSGDNSGSGGSGGVAAPGDPSGNVWLVYENYVGDSYLGDYNGTAYTAQAQDTTHGLIGSFLKQGTKCYQYNLDASKFFYVDESDFSDWTELAITIPSAGGGRIVSDGTYLYVAGGGNDFQRMTLPTGAFTDPSGGAVYSKGGGITVHNGALYMSRNNSGEYDVNKSTDNGATWAPVGVISHDKVGVAFFASDDSRLIVCYERLSDSHVVIEYSDDDGATWSGVVYTFPAPYTSFIDAVGSGLLYDGTHFVGILNNGKTAYSANGASWTAGATIPREVKYVSQGIGKIVAGCTHLEMYETTDHGATWTAFLAPVAAGGAGDFIYPYWIGSDPSLPQTGPVVSWAAFDHLEGQEVQVIGDGILQTNKTVTAGAITIDSPAVYLDVGLPYTHKVVTLSPEIQGPTGSIQGKIQRAYEVALLLKDTIGATVNGTPMSFQTFGPTVLDVPIEPFTGWKDVGLLGYDTVNEITITSSDPLPFHLLAVVRRVDIGAWK